MNKPLLDSIVLIAFWAIPVLAICLLAWPSVILINQVRRREQVSRRSVFIFYAVLLGVSVVGGIYTTIASALDFFDYDRLIAGVIIMLAYLLAYSVPAVGLLIYRRYQPRLEISRRGILGRILAGWCLLVLSLLLSGVYVEGAEEITLTDEHGQPLVGGFADYKVLPRMPCILPHGLFLRSDSAGRISIPRRVHLHLPLGGIGFERAVDLHLCAPVLHNCASLYWRSAQGWTLPEVRGLHRADLKQTPSGAAMVFQDLAERPGAREESLRLGVQMYNPLRNGEAPALVSAADLRDYAVALRKDYDDFVARYGDIIRDDSHSSAKQIQDEYGLTKWDDRPKPWRFFLDLPWYGMSTEQRLARLEEKAGTSRKR